MDPLAISRELLVAEAALRLGVAEPRDVALALQRAWERRDHSDTSLLAELGRIAELGDDTVGRIRAAVEQSRAATATVAGPRAPPTEVDSGLGEVDPAPSLTLHGVPVRAVLRPLPPGRYTGFEPVGAGGMGVVYATIDSEMNRRVAMKLVRPPVPDGATDGPPPSSPIRLTRPSRQSPEYALFDDLKARLVQEAWVTGGLEHPGIVPVYEMGRTPAGIPYYTMRYIRGDRTLAHAIAEKGDAAFHHRIALLEPFLRVCDAVHYAHDKGIVHRDLKPSNVALGEYGEVVVLDWGLAHLEHHGDQPGSVWRSQVDVLREDAGFRTADGGVIGTAGYLAPEAARGRREEIDRASDVYSLGATLFELLTGRLPFTFDSYADYAKRILHDVPPLARAIDPTIPDALSDLCARALSRDKTARPPSAQAIADAIRSWQTQDAIDREAEASIRDARTMIESAERLAGAARLREADRAAAALALAASRRPAADGEKELGRRIEALREAGVRERARAGTRRALRIVAVGGLAAAAVAATIFGNVVDGKRREAEDARSALHVAVAEKSDALRAVEKERDAKSEALDAKRVRDLADDAERLWPIAPGTLPALSNWIEECREVLSQRTLYRDRRAALRELARPYDEAAQAADRAEAHRRVEEATERRDRAVTRAARLVAGDADPQRGALFAEIALLEKTIERLRTRAGERLTWSFDDSEHARRHAMLTDILRGLDRLDGRDGGPDLFATVVQRERLARSVAEPPQGDVASLWEATIAGVAASRLYSGLRLVAQPGLVPLGADPRSGLFEFAHVGSGSIPTRDTGDGTLLLADDTAIVLVLIPGGTFSMGAQREDPAAPNHDPDASPDEGPIRSVTVPPYLIGKHEVTQSQWHRISEGLNPSTYPRRPHSDRTLPSRHPVESIRWDESRRHLERHRLTLPTEAQWERACRAGSASRWSFGSDVALLSRYANISDRHLRLHGGKPTFEYTDEVDDGHAIHAPVQSYEANRFGLHDMHGNVMEWCLDMYATFGDDIPPAPPTERPSRVVLRGGSWGDPARNTRSSFRIAVSPTMAMSVIGVRAAASLHTE